MDVEERRSAENLILLCNTCHTLVDSEFEKYTVQILRRWKADREARFRAVGDTLYQRYIDEIVDEAEVVGYTIPKSLKRYVEYLDRQNVDHDVNDETPGEVREFVEKLRHLSVPDRQLLLVIVEKAIALGGSRETEYGVQVHADDLRTIQINRRPLSYYRVRKFSKTLERNSLGSMDFDEEPELYICAIDDFVS